MSEVTDPVEKPAEVETADAGCCEASSSAGMGEACPRSRTKGQNVAWRTVAALTQGPLPPRQAFRICTEPSCSVVYFGDQGAILETGDLAVEPGFKNPVDGLLCYCFGHRRSHIQSEIERQAELVTSIPEEIRAKTRAGDCACEVRNPTGRCCLGEISRFVGSVKSGL